MRHIALIVVLLLLIGCDAPGSRTLNDVHSRLNATRVASVHYPRSTADVVRIVKQAKESGQAVSISGGRHAMGGQQFGEGAIHISMSRMNDVLDFDRQRGIVRVEAGIDWPTLVQYLLDVQANDAHPWGIVQKQTGADRLSIGGSLSANVHGRGARFKPIIQDVESFTLVNAAGQVLRVSRTEHPELFGLVIGGYGLFGVITTVDLRLARRVRLQRSVEIVSIEDLADKVRQRLAEGFLYGDYQYKTDPDADDFMRTGVFSTYKPVPHDANAPEPLRRLSPDNWRELLLLAHTDKGRAFEYYSRYYLSTHGQYYWSDTHQMSYYDDRYVEFLRQALPSEYPEGSLMITEVYVPRDRLLSFITDMAEEARQNEFDIIYGTMRLIERDDESFLAWAKQDYACVIFNLRVEHSPSGLVKAQRDFRKIIDMALDLDGSYYLTYHRWARIDQVLRAYPQFPEFLRLKLKYDPEERFQSDWYRHYKSMFNLLSTSKFPGV